MEPKFSVIVPIYKVESFLMPCVDSILAQTYRNFELILVDDGSPDACPSICDAYAEKDDRVRVVHKANGGVGSARIAGSEVATGDYVCCVDGDDWVHPAYLEKFAEAIQKTDADVVCSGSIWAYEEKNVYYPLSYTPGFYDEAGIRETFFSFLIENEQARYFSVSIWNKAYRRSLYVPEQLSVNPQIKIGEDVACVTSVISKAKSLYVLEDCLYYYRQNPASMTKEKKAFAWNGPGLIYNHIKNRIDLEQGDFQDQLYRKTIHGIFSVSVTQFYRKESYRTICKDIKEHLKDPVYAEAIKKAKYKCLYGRLVIIALRYRMMWLMKLWSIIHNA